jgi:acetylglutamate kinase
MDVVEMVLTGRVNKSLVTLIQQAGGRAVGLCGKDSAMLDARQMVEKVPQLTLGLRQHSCTATAQQSVLEHIERKHSKANQSQCEVDGVVFSDVSQRAQRAGP